MNALTYDLAMSRVFADEGGYTNDPKDPGGPTNWGITIFDARKYWKADATAEDVKSMPKSVAGVIYRKHYADPLQYDALPAGFDYSVLDAGINSGVGRAVPWGGKALGQATNNIGTVVSLANAYPDKVKAIQKYWAIRLGFLQSLKTWSHFGKGWGRRVANGEAAAVKMWLTIGAKLPAPSVASTMNTEKNKASAKSKQAGTGAATTGAASASPAAPGVDITHLSLGGKIAIGVGIALLIALAVYLIHKAVVHNQRATAYAAA